MSDDRATADRKSDGDLQFRVRLATFLQNCEKLTLSAVPNIVTQR